MCDCKARPQFADPNSPQFVCDPNSFIQLAYSYGLRQRMIPLGNGLIYSAGEAGGASPPECSPPTAL